ncbi:MAG TPA: ABC transporter permease [Candidatus Limnocylindrales bacterium]|nr:ABC transporter permease [Candidatus Limnocylindrales bacterium]
MRPDEPLVDWAWIADHLDDIGIRLGQHLGIATLAVAVGLALAMALALWARRTPGLRGPVTGVTGILYTIPSLAMFAALVPFTGLSLLTAEIPLVVYTLLILFRNIMAGFDAVPDEVREAADGMGYRSGERLRQIELPLAIPLIIAGIRLASVSTIGLVMIVSLLGRNFGGLGVFITEGIQTFFATKVYVGAALSVTLAVAADLTLVALERRTTPWAGDRAAAIGGELPGTP